MMHRPEMFQCGEADCGHDELAIVRNRDGGFTITVEEPWAGDTETGFGRTCSITISNKMFRQLMEWLVRYY
jgi:hypothetical protein